MVANLSGRAFGPGDVLGIFRDGTPRTRAELASLTGMSRSAVTLRIDSLLALGMVAPVPGARSSGGRPPAQLAFNTRLKVAVGAALGATHGRVGITDLNGKVIDSSYAEFDIGIGPERTLAWIISTTRDLLDRLGLHDDDVIGLGIGVPGPVDHERGRVSSPPIMAGWHNFDIPSYVGATFAPPVMVDNDVNVLALGCHRVDWPSTHDLVFVKVSTGIGLGIIAGGDLQRGSKGAAGDLGRVNVPNLPERNQELESVSSGPAIARQIRAQGVPAHSAADVIELVESGSPVAIAAVRDAGRNLGEVLATVIDLLNPAVLVIGGSVARAGEHLLAGVREVIYARSPAMLTQDLRVARSLDSEHQGIIGASLLVIEDALSVERIDLAVAAFESAQFAMRITDAST